MPKLTVPSSNGSTNRTPLSPSGVAGAVASGAKIGNVMQNQAAPGILSAEKLGDLQRKMGDWEYEQYQASQKNKGQNPGNSSNRSSNEPIVRGQPISSYAELAQNSANTAQIAMDQAAYNTAQSSAVRDLNEQSANIIDQTLSPVETPEDIHSKAINLRNPYAPLKEIDSTAKKIASDYGDTLYDAASREELNQSVSQAATNQKMIAGSAVRTAQVDLTDKSLGEAIKNDVKAGLLDSPENLGYYSSQGLGRITKALEAGLISVDQARNLQETLRKGLYYGSLQVANQKNPTYVKRLLGQGAEKLNISPVEYQQLSKENQLALRDSNTLSKIQYQAQKETDASQKRMVEFQLTQGIKDGTVHQAQILERYNKGEISSDQLIKLASVYDDSSRKVNKTNQTRADISATMASNQPLYGYNKTQIEDHYLNQVRRESSDGSLNIPLSRKVEMATQYNAPLDSLSKEIQYRIMSGDQKQIEEGLAAYNKIKADAPMAFTTSDNKFESYASALSNAYKYTTSLDPANIQKIHDSIYKVPTHTQRARINSYGEESSFQPKNIKETIRDIIPDANPWFGRDADIPDSVVGMVEPLLYQNYMLSGDADTAKDTTAKQISAYFGTSQVNATGTGEYSAVKGMQYQVTNSPTAMMLPPEKIISGATSEELRKSINKELLDSGVLPEGINPNQVMIGSDDLTMETFRRSGKANYYLFYKDKEGNDVLLPTRWGYDNVTKGNIQQERRRIALADKNVGTANVQAGLRLDPNQKTGTVPPSKPTPAQPQPKLIDQVMSKIETSGNYLSEIEKLYPGDAEARPVVGNALRSMVGKDPESWRVKQSLEVINSALTGDIDPSTALKIGYVTTSPQSGDLVATKTGTGLFDRYVKLDGRQAVQVISFDGQNIVKNVVPLDQVRGFRSLPTPEEYASSSARQLNTRNQQRFNPFTGEQARVGTGNERINMFTGETEIVDPNAEPEKKVLNPVTGELVSQDPTFKEKAEQSLNKTPGVKTTVINGSVNTGDTNLAQRPNTSTTWWDSLGSSSSKSKDEAKTTANVKPGGTVLVYNAETGNIVPVNIKKVAPDSMEFTEGETDQVFSAQDVVVGVKKGSKVLLKNGTIAMFEMFQNGKVRLQSGRTVELSEIESIQDKS